MGRKCAVPHCYTGYRKCNEKASLYRVPDDDFFLSKWQEAIAREDRPITPKDYVCEKHFKDDDILRRRIIKDVVEQYQRPRLKPDAIPSIFPDLPEYILKMVKKRRKIPSEDPKLCDSSINIENTEQNISEEQFLMQEIKTEPPDINGANDLVSSVCQTILNNEIDIKSEPEDEEYVDSVKIDAENEQDCNFGPKMHQCDKCDYQTKYPHNLRTHETKHLTGDEAYIYCEHCPKFKTKWETTYRNHVKIKHGIVEVFRCSFCLFATKVKVCLKRHLERHQRNSSANISSDFTEKSSSFRCTECCFETNSKGHISRHVRTAHDAGDGTIFALKSKTEDKSMYKCLKCSYRSKSQKNLLKHALEHKYQRPWKCPKCSFATFYQYALLKHQENDCESLLSCNECNFKSNYRTDFIQHMLTHRNVSVELTNRELFGMSSTILGQNLMETRLEQMISPEKLRRGDKVNNNPEFVVVKSEIPDL